MTKIKALIALALLGVAVLPPASAQLQAHVNLTLMSAQKTNSALIGWPGGVGVFTAVGTWNGATVTLQYLGPDGTTLVTVGAATTLTANGAGVFYLPANKIQATVSNPGASTSLTASAAE